MTILANGLNTAYVTGPELQDVFVDKSTGQLLANGKIFFYEDINRNIAKSVYRLSYNSMTGIYSYVALSNPLTLSVTGTFDDGNNNNIPIYYYPYDEFGNLQLYYVAAYDSNNLLQFTRDAWPFPNSGAAGGGGGGTSSTTLSLNNMLTNPQFAVVNFTSDSTLSIPYTSSGVSFTIAPGWVINVGATGAGTLTIAQTPVTGSSAYPYNPPFLLTVTPGQFITSLTLTQTLNSNPDWAAPQSTGIGGYLSGSILLAPNSSLTMNYLKNAGAPASQTIFSQTNTSGAFTQFNSTIELAMASNIDTGLNGFDTIQLVLSNSAVTSFSNVQVVPLTSNVVITSFDQTPVNRQIDQMFNYYNPQLQYKPTSSWLIGWNFPANPAQQGAAFAAQAIGANKSYYSGWDQTIFFQSATSGITISRDTSKALKTLAQNTGQIALIQYLPATAAIEMLSRRKCVMIGANASTATVATVSLWYTKTSLPSTIGSNNSIVATLDADGYPATLNGTWIQVPRSGLSNAAATPTATNAAQFTIGTNATANFNQYSFSGWDMAGNTDINNATFFAIVVGTASLTATASILWQFVTCQDGDIPTVPQVKEQDFRDCLNFWRQSFLTGTTPASGLALGNGEYRFAITDTGQTLGPCVSFEKDMNTVPAIVTYTPVAGGSAMYNITNSAVFSGTSVAAITAKGFTVSGGPAGGANVGNTAAVSWSADSRLGQ